MRHQFQIGTCDLVRGTDGTYETIDGLIQFYEKSSRWHIAIDGKVANKTFNNLLDAVADASRRLENHYLNAESYRAQLVRIDRTPDGFADKVVYEGTRHVAQMRLTETIQNLTALGWSLTTVTVPHGNTRFKMSKLDRSIMFEICAV